MFYVHWSSTEANNAAIGVKTFFIVFVFKSNVMSDVDFGRLWWV